MKFYFREGFFSHNLVVDSSHLAVWLFTYIAAVDSKRLRDSNKDRQVKVRMTFHNSIGIFLEIAWESCIADNVRTDLMINDVVKVSGSFQN